MSILEETNLPEKVSRREEDRPARPAGVMSRLAEGIRQEEMDTKSMDLPEETIRRGKVEGEYGTDQAE